MNITKVDEHLKNKILNWLYSISLIKDNIPEIDKKLPKICRNGFIFFDLINRLEGKNNIIKGAIKEPKSIA